MILYELNVCSSRESWTREAENQGMTPVFLPGSQVSDSRGRQKLLETLREGMKGHRALLLFSDRGMQEGMADLIRELPQGLSVIPVGADAMLLHPGTEEPRHRSQVNSYLTYGGEENLRAMMAYLAYYLFGNRDQPEPAEPQVLPMDGIWWEDRIYPDLDGFLRAEKQVFPHYLGLLSHRSSWLQGKLEPEQALIRALNRENIGVIPVFSAGEKSELLESLDFEGVMDRFFRRKGKLAIEGLINFQVHLIKGRQGKSIGETASELFQTLGIPVFHPVISFYATAERWRQQNNPLYQEINMAYLNPEMAGMIEPILLALPSEDRKTLLPLRENAELLASRMGKWLALRTTPNSDKKVALILHNAVCAGVEATLGKAYGLDAFESTVRLMRQLQARGYTIKDIPENGEALRKLLIRKKAFSDFRWTSVEDILESGGCLYEMPRDPEYMGYFRELPEEMQQHMRKTWGDPPGEGMVHGSNLVVTGLNFGNFLVLVQPKRGCYGAKCTGEVCRILHDPVCPPAHQYLATYRYLERDWQASAVIHMGTDGSLEYLPGKASGLGMDDWTYRTLGSLLNFYPYHLGVPSEGTIAKRRAGASVVGYYPGSSRGLDPEEQSLLSLIGSYQEAESLENGQAPALWQELEARLAGRPLLRKLQSSAPTRQEGLELVQQSLLKAAQARKRSELHIFGEDPDRQEAMSYLCEVLRSEEALKRLPEEGEADYGQRLQLWAEQRLSEGDEELQLLSDRLLQTHQEMGRLLELLDGGYQPPCEAGMPDENGRRILPAGRNFYMMNGEKIPTGLAWERGRMLADQLLEAYLQDEGAYPRKVAMNMISLDISRTHGEQLSEFLWLLGVRPVWDPVGRVRDLEPMSLTELGRPRIDVTVRISGVMRDTWPGAVDWMDRAVLLVSGLPEPEEQNYILYNIRRMEESCGALGDRDKTIRIFGDPPGAFGAGIDLALKASAWEKDKDLARYFIQSSAFAYGRDLQGRKSIREFVENGRQVEVSTDVSSSRRMDSLSCGFGVQVQGGFQLLAGALGQKKIRQYQASSEPGTKIRTTTLSQKVEEDVETTLLDPLWQENMRRRGYQGAAEIMRRIQTGFDAQCTGNLLKDETLDALAEAYLNDEEMRQWLLGENPYAAEEIGRRLLELESRGKWKPGEEVLARLRENYLSLEGSLEEGISGRGEIQAGTVEIVGDDKVELWQEKLRDIDDYLESLEKK